MVNKSDVEENDYSLTPGRYVGIQENLDEEFDYKEEMSRIRRQLQTLNQESFILAEQIQENLKKLNL